MDEEFDDDELDILLSQVEIKINPEQQQSIQAQKDEGVFKKPAQPKYAFNRFQTNRPDLLSQPSQQKQQQTRHPGSINKSNTVQANKINQTNQNNQNKLNQSNKPNNQQTPANSQSKSNAISSTANQNKVSNHDATFVKPLQPNHLKMNSTQLSSNLEKSLKAQSVNKQNLNRFNTINKSHSTASSNTSNRTADNSLTTNKTSASSQSKLNDNSNSESKILSQFSISDNVSAPISVNPMLKKELCMNDQGIDPSDKYIGRIEMLEKKINEAMKELDRKNLELTNCKETIERQNDEIRAVRSFNDKERMTREFKDNLLNTTIDKTSPILNKTISTTTYQIKKQSPKPKSNKFATQQTQIRNNQNELSQHVNGLENLDLDDTMSDDSMIPETQVPPSSKILTPSASQNEANTKLDLSLPIPTLDDNAAHYESDDEIPETQDFNVTQESPEFESRKTVLSIKEESDSPQRLERETNIKRIKIENEMIENLVKDDAVFHEIHFKFIDFQVYDYLDNSNEMKFFLDKINPQYDLILERIGREDLMKLAGEFDLKFSKLNEQLILVLLFDFDVRSNIPKLTFNLLTTLQQYNNFLDDKQLITKLTSKCIIEDKESECRFREGRTLLNRILDILRYCREKDAEISKDYQLLCYSIILFLIQNTADANTFKEFHRFAKNDPDDKCQCWKEVIFFSVASAY